MMFTPGKKPIEDFLASIDLSEMVGQFHDIGVFYHDQLKYICMADLKAMTTMSIVQHRIIQAEIIKIQTPISRKVVEANVANKSRKTLFGDNQEPENEKVQVHIFNIISRQLS